MNPELEEIERDRDGFQFLVATVRLLRDPDGCPWDGEQTHLSLRPNLLEEAYETLEALESGDGAALEEELGDLLIQIVFHADIARRNGDFDADSVCRKVAEKLIRRHPHVFGDADKLDTGEDVINRWERIKREEAGGVRSIVASVPKALPALAQSAVLQRRARRSGLDISSGANDANEFVGRGPAESDVEVEIRAGEFLAAAVRQVQEQGVDPETALLKVNSALRERVLRAEKLAEGVALSELSAKDREQIWERAR
ncbi:MAG: MazG family protein [Chloroflexi bacterium]|nr:MazG family protein [Chloroflexota bacterium]